MSQGLFDRAHLRVDVIAGLTAAAVILPKALAYATVARLPVAVGLYTAFIPVVAYALLGTSRVLSVTSTATLAILTATELEVVVPGGEPGSAGGAPDAAVCHVDGVRRFRGQATGARRASLARGLGVGVRLWGALGGTQILFTAFLGAAWHHETLGLRRWVCMVITVAAIASLAFAGG